MKNKSFTVAMLGAGNIGSAVIDRLENLDNEIVEIDLKSVLVSDISKERTFNTDIVTDNFEDILNDDSIDLVIEVLGGCLLYTSPSPRDKRQSRMPSSA